VDVRDWSLELTKVIVGSDPGATVVAVAEVTALTIEEEVEKDIVGVVTLARRDIGCVP
jgi:hypothetical protein